VSHVWQWYPARFTLSVLFDQSGVVHLATRSVRLLGGRSSVCHSAITYPFSDLALARRLERAKASKSATFVETRAELQPGLQATWTEVAGAYAMFDGVDSPLTQSFGLGLFETIGPEEMQTLECFFRDRGAEVFHEVSPLADPSVMTLLNGEAKRGHH
jgi:hypothetical protein